MSEDQTYIPEPRLVEETGLEARIAAIIEPVVGSMGYQLVRIRTTGENGMTVQIMAERFDGTMAVEDCEAISRAISPVLEVEDPIERAYHLEISSPGIDRPMVRKSDFAKWQDQLIKCETSIFIDERKRFRGWIKSVSEEAFVLNRENLKEGEAQEVTIPFDALVEGKLILTDDLVEATLRADNQSKKQRRNAANQNQE